MHAIVCASLFLAFTPGVADGNPIDRLVASVCDKKLVLLGELPSHGEAETFLAKAEVVRRLVGECGFDTLVFEAGIYDFVGLQRALAARTSSQEQLDRAIGPFWGTPELGDWRAWALNRARAGELALFGMDDQLGATGEFGKARLPELVASALAGERSAECRAAVERHVNWRYGPDTPFDDDAGNKLRGCASAAASGRAATPEDAAMLDNLARWLDRPDGRAGAEDRDRSMARNLEWIASRRPEGAGIVVWTATVHAARSAAERPFAPTASLLDGELLERAAAIGFTALRGESSMAGMPARPLPELPEDSLEARATTGDEPLAWLDADRLKALGVVPSRLFGSPSSADWSIYFDGVLVIRDERGPAAP